MRLLRTYPLLLFCIVLSAVNVQASDSTAAAYVTIEGVEEGLPVFVDRHFTGVTPLFRHPVAIGRHEIIVRSPWWPAWNVPDFASTIDAVAGETLIVHPRFVEPLYIESTPYGAEVFLDDDKAGVTPLMIRRTAGSDTLLRILKPGYETYESQLSAHSGPIVSVILQAREDWIRAEISKKRQRQSRLTRNRRLLAGAMVLGLASGLTTVHYRDQGNEAYDRYLHTANPNAMKRHFEDARHYDRLAGLSYAVFEVAFLLGGYFFLGSREP